MCFVAHLRFYMIAVWLKWVVRQRIAPWGMEKLEGGRGKAVLSWLKWHVQYIYWQGIANALRKLLLLSFYHWMPSTNWDVVLCIGLSMFKTRQVYCDPVVKLLWLIFLTAWYLKFDKDIISHSPDSQHSLRAGNVFKGFRRGPLKSVYFYGYCIAHFWLQYCGRMKMHF